MRHHHHSIHVEVKILHFNIPGLLDYDVRQFSEALPSNSDLTSCTQRLFLGDQLLTLLCVFFNCIVIFNLANKHCFVLPATCEVMLLRAALVVPCFEVDLMSTKGKTGEIFMVLCIQTKQPALPAKVLH